MSEEGFVVPAVILVIGIAASTASVCGLAADAIVDTQNQPQSVQQWAVVLLVVYVAGTLCVLAFAAILNVDTLRFARLHVSFKDQPEHRSEELRRLSTRLLALSGCVSVAVLVWAAGSSHDKANDAETAQSPGTTPVAEAATTTTGVASSSSGQAPIGGQAHAQPLPALPEPTTTRPAGHTSSVPASVQADEPASPRDPATTVTSIPTTTSTSTSTSTTTPRPAEPPQGDTPSTGVSYPWTTSGPGFFLQATVMSSTTSAASQFAIVAKATVQGQCIRNVRVALNDGSADAIVPLDPTRFAGEYVGIVSIGAPTGTHDFVVEVAVGACDGSQRVERRHLPGHFVVAESRSVGGRTP